MNLPSRKTRSDLFRAICLSCLFFAIFLPNFATRPVAAVGTVPEYIEEYSIPTPASAPLAIVVDNNGVVWFTESNASKLARFDPVSREFTEYPVPWVGDMWGLAFDHSGGVWFTQYSGKGSVNPGGSIVLGGSGSLVRFDSIRKNFTSINIPTVGSFPMRLVVDGQNRVWFTEFLGNKIGVYDQAKNQLTEYPVPTNESGPADLTLGRNGDLWFTESYAMSLGEFFPQNQSFIEYPIGYNTESQVIGSPVGLAQDDQGNVWVADHGGSWILEFNPETRAIIKYPTHIPPADVYPISLVNDLLIDSQGRVWFVEHAGNAVGYLSIENRSMTEFPVPTGPISTSLWIALAPNGDIWFTEWSTNKIGVAHSNLPVPVSISVSSQYLRMASGDETTISILTKASQETNGNGTLRYSWSSYNTQDISVSFSSPYPSLADLVGNSAQAKLFLSSTINAGNYTLGIGLDTGRATVWSMIEIQVSLEAPAAPVATSITLALLATASAALLVGLMLITLVRRHPRAKPASPT